MHQNMLKLNTDKTEVMLFASKHNSRHMSSISVQVGGSKIASTNCVRNLGTTMSMEKQVISICRSGYTQLRNIGRIRRYLTNDATKSLVHGLVTSRLENCNDTMIPYHDDQATTCTEHRGSHCDQDSQTRPYHSCIETTTLATS